MRDSKILITGATGQVATPIALALAADNEVWGIARFTDAAARERLEHAGVRCETVNLAAGDFTGLPSDFDYVLNLAVAKSGRLGQGPGGQRGVGRPARWPTAAAQRRFCTVHPAAVYDPPDDELRTERAALGDNHKPLFPTYSISKIAGEAVARTMARVLGVPTTIARLNVPYGDNGGWPFYHMEMMLAGIPIPVPPGGPARYNPIHEDDIIATIPKLLEVASVPATTVNWAGDQIVSIQEWCTYLGSLRRPGAGVRGERSGAARESRWTSTRMHELIGAAHGRLAGRDAPDGGQVPSGVDRQLAVEIDEVPGNGDADRDLRWNVGCPGWHISSATTHFPVAWPPYRWCGRTSPAGRVRGRRGGRLGVWPQKGQLASTPCDTVPRRRWEGRRCRAGHAKLVSPRSRQPGWFRS